MGASGTSQNGRGERQQWAGCAGHSRMSDVQTKVRWHRKSTRTGEGTAVGGWAHVSQWQCGEDVQTPSNLRDNFSHTPDERFGSLEHASQAE